MSLTIRGLQRAQAMQQRAYAALQPSGALGQAIQYITAHALRYVISITHVDTGALRASHRMLVGPARGSIYLSPVGANPRTGQRPAEYGVYEHARGGEHAFYDRTSAEVGEKLLKQGVSLVVGAIR